MNENNKTTKDLSLMQVEGALDRKAIESLFASLKTGVYYTFDFSNATTINFAAMRTMLNYRQAGFRFSIINANDSIAEKLEDTGVASIINMCRKPKHLDISKYQEFGGSFLSKSFNSNDGDSMLKLYGPNVPKRMVAQEKSVAKAVMLFGIPTPLVGTLYEDGDMTALDFERIEGKKSFSRIIANEPDRLEEITVRFARMCKQLHTTPCDTNIFADRSVTYRQAIVNLKEFNDEEKEQMLDFVNNIPVHTTCLHGDCQMSNVITNGEIDLWIDLADFGYGNPMFDMGMWYFLSRLNTEENMIKVFNFGKETMDKIWPIFVREYFGADTPEKQAEAERQIEPFAALHMAYLSSVYFSMPFMIEYIRKTLLKQ